MPLTLPERFAQAMGAALGPDFPDRLGLAVSGGGDSMAMLHLCAGWARVWGVDLSVVTVDHGLRPESAAEARLVADEAAGLGLGHVTLDWAWDGQGNLADAARRGRRAAIGAWAHGRTVLMAHTRDDQAETLLLRLARGSGVDGLAAMAPLTQVGDWGLLRPLLDVGRAELRHYLSVLRIPYVDDPSNADEASARVRMRGLIGREGLSTERLAGTAAAMARASVALEARARDVAARVRRPVSDGCLAFDRDGLAAVEAETRLRLLATAIRLVGGGLYPPRLSALEELAERTASGGAATLQGAIVVPWRDRVTIAREPQAVAQTVTGPEGPWDGRWTCDRRDAGVQLRALGDGGLAQVTVRPDDAAPHACLPGLPALWSGDRLIACPALNFGPCIGLRDTRRAPFPRDLGLH